MVKLTQRINWSQFSNKHKNYIKNALSNKMNVAEGAIRSGKTIDHCIIAAAYLEECADKIHLASGSTIANAKLNIGVCNGFGLENLFRGRCRWGKYKDNEALFIQTQTGEKIIIFAGGAKSDSYKKILGNSYGMWIATEINEHFDSDDSRISFIKVAFGRQAAAVSPFVLWDLNPCNPNHSIYKDYIDKYKSNYIGGYQYEHFTINDNLSISDERKKELLSQYDPETIWYQRDILGKRCVAEGLVYPFFNDKCIVENYEATPADEYYISMDYGTMNPCSMGLWAINRESQIAIRIKEFYYDGRKSRVQMTDEDYYCQLEKLVGGKLIQSVIVDPSASSFITLVRQRGQFAVRNAKNDVVYGIRHVNMLLKKGKIKIHKSCTDCIGEFRSYMYDPKAIDDIPIKENDHAMDDVRYMVYTILKYEGW